MAKKRRASKPPNLRASQSCGTCPSWEWGYEGEGECKRHPARFLNHLSMKRNYDPASTLVCDDWGKKPEETT